MDNLSTKTSDLSKKIRIQILKLAYLKKVAHIGSSLSIVDVLVQIFNIFDMKPSSFNENRLRLLYSKGHACLAYYCILEEYKFIENLKENFIKDGGLITSHISHKVHGIEYSTGSLGHALPIASGVAYSLKMDNNPAKVICILSDGELNEGSNWESFLFNQHHNLNNLLIVIDYNKLQSFGFTNEVLNLEPLIDKFISFNYLVKTIDGHNHNELQKNLLDFKNNLNSKPTILICNTIKGKGISFYENQLSSHYKSPTEEEFTVALKELENA